MSYDTLLSQSCTIQTKANNWTSAGDGTVVETWSDTYEEVACRRVNHSGALPEKLQGYDPASIYTLFVKSDQTISAGDRITDLDSLTYLVEYVHTVEGKSGTHHKEATIRAFEVS